MKRLYDRWSVDHFLADNLGHTVDHVYEVT